VGQGMLGLPAKLFPYGRELRETGDARLASPVCAGSQLFPTMSTGGDLVSGKADAGLAYSRGRGTPRGSGK